MKVHEDTIDDTTLATLVSEIECHLHRPGRATNAGHTLHSNRLINAGWRVRAAGQAVWPVCRSQQQQHLSQAWLCNSSLSCTRRDVRINKFEVRISPQILTKDPQPRPRGRHPSVGR